MNLKWSVIILPILILMTIFAFNVLPMRSFIGSSRQRPAILTSMACPIGTAFGKDVVLARLHSIGQFEISNLWSLITSRLLSEKFAETIEQSLDPLALLIVNESMNPNIEFQPSAKATAFLFTNSGRARLGKSFFISFMPRRNHQAANKINEPKAANSPQNDKAKKSIFSHRSIIVINITFVMVVFYTICHIICGIKHKSFWYWLEGH